MTPSGTSLVFRHPASRVRRGPLREFLGELERRLARGRSIVCLVTGDRELRDLNRRFRGKNTPTDVLSFVGPGFQPAAAFPGGIPRSTSKLRAKMPAKSRLQAESLAPLGELAISLDRARAQAAEHGHTLDDELRILMLHGALHLAGFDHEHDQGEMARAESRWRKRLGLPNGLIERSGQ